MSALSSEDKTARARQRLLDKAAEMSLGKYIRKFVARDFQAMIRAEAAAQPAGYTPAIVDGKLTQVYRRVGECVCVTCGRVGPWKSWTDSDRMNGGHFVGGRSQSIVLTEENIAPQCAWCNKHESGARAEYRMWMLAVRGKETVDRLERQRHADIRFTRDELVDKRLEYRARLKAAETRMLD